MSRPIEQLDLAREVRGLKRKVAELLTRLEQPVGEPDYTIPGWCHKRKVSRSNYYKMKKAGRGPRTIENGGLIRISRSADAEWEERWGSGATTDDEGTAA